MSDNIEIGTLWKTRGKHPRVAEVIDIHTTTNSKGEIVKTEYLCSHEFMGQQIKHLECKTTILQGIARMNGEL